MTKPRKGFWVCAWHAIYGNIDPDTAYRPDSEIGVVTAEGETICYKCDRKYWRERAKAESGD